MIYFVKGAMDRVLSNCSRFYDHGALSGISEKQKKEYTYQASTMGNAGLRGNYSRFYNNYSQFYGYCNYSQFYDYSALSSIWEKQWINMCIRHS